MKPIFMILGGSRNHIKAINKAKELGLSPLVVDKDAECMGSRIADFFEPVDTTDLVAVEEVARRYKIVGSMTLSSEIAVPTACYINEKLNLPNQGKNIGQQITDKHFMREKFKYHNVRSPQFYKIQNEKELQKVGNLIKNQLFYKSFIVKPSDSSGSRGITKVVDFSNFQAAVNQAMKLTRNGKVIVEEFVHGTKIGAEAFSIQGEMVLCLLHNSSISSNMISTGHSFPVSIEEHQLEEIKNECRKALNSLGIINGPSNLDIILDQAGHPYIIEVNARIPGSCLPELIKAHTGIDIYELSIQLASGKKVEIPIPQKNVPVAFKRFYINDPDILIKIREYQWLLEPNKPIEYQIENQYGYVICQGENSRLAEDNCSLFYQKLNSLIEYEKIDAIIYSNYYIKYHKEIKLVRYEQ